MVDVIRNANIAILKDILKKKKNYNQLKSIKIGKFRGSGKDKTDVHTIVKIVYVNVNSVNVYPKPMASNMTGWN